MIDLYNRTLIDEPNNEKQLRGIPRTPEEQRAQALAAVLLQNGVTNFNELSKAVVRDFEYRCRMAGI